MKKGRGRFYDTLFAKERPCGNAIRTPRDNAGGVGYASDSSLRRKSSALIPFFNEPAMTNTAISRIAKASGAQCCRYFCRRLQTTHTSMNIGAPLPGLPSDDEVQDTAPG